MGDERGAGQEADEDAAVPRELGEKVGDVEDEQAAPAPRVAFSGRGVGQAFGKAHPKRRKPRIALERAHDDRIERREHVAVDARRRRDLRLEHLAHRVAVVAALEQALQRERLPQHAAERPDVAPLVRGARIHDLLGRHVERRPERDERLRVDQRRLPLHLHALRDTEVEQLHAVRRQKHIGGLEIPVHDAPLVRGLEAGGDLQRDADRILEAERPTGNQISRRRAVGELQHSAGVRPRSNHVVIK